ncbi:hypothetical protein N7491_006392 [Penicillium cf. griseofulvum]|uniref:Uncharacterized protein n=1 Tax=Penicillium cf. griseofulvum TaxID=2972120 RepID=A0A9W9M1J5_9EURO|nr:hypothetical protein N7472_010580 [Penicillium cf. griseofulvum]KAJ5429376.1 hypothetical protein N7491_006392 [Penicillium cf. griseofulvum]KAJ5436845.1 hypothetical protein N7445_007730 [Penicillium cf. griseofulvum]
MASLKTVGSAGPDVSLPGPFPPTAPSSSIMSALPDGYVVHHFSRFKLLRTCAEVLAESLRTESKSVSQWLVVLGLSQSAIRRLNENHKCLEGIEYRFAWEGQAGLIKIVHSFDHDSVTDGLTRVMDLYLIRMGLVSITSRKWVVNTTYKPTANKGKEADQGFLPPSRLPPTTGSPPGWPTLTIETGLSESLSQLRQDARWWLSNSLGEVRIVLVISISKQKDRVFIEMWQLAPPNSPRPLTRAYVQTLCQRNPNVPPLIQQPASSQTAYCAHELTITANGVTGAPLTLPFAALYDRPPAQGEGDIVLTAQDFLDITSVVF